MNIEEIATKFVNLANKSHLSGAEHQDVLNSMKLLKASGMSCEEISQLSNGRWCTSTVKGYVKGVKSTTNPGSWPDAVTLLNDILANGLTLNDLNQALTLRNDIDSRGIDINQITDFLIEADAASIDLSAIFQQHVVLKKSGLSLQDISKVLTIKQELEDKGLSIEFLDPLLQMTKNYNEPQKMIDAVAKYGSLTEIEEQISKVDSQLQGKYQELNDKQKEIEEADIELSDKKEVIESLQKVASLGYTSDELEKLAALTIKYGGVKKVIDAVMAEVDYLSIISKTNDAQANLSNVQASINKEEAKYNHIKSAVDMCLTLTGKYGYGLDAISTILSTAEKYGEPVNLLKALEAYGSLKSLENERHEQQGIISEQNAKISHLKGEYETVLSNLESLNVTALKVGKEVGKARGELEASNELMKIVNFIVDPTSAKSGEFGHIVWLTAMSLYKYACSNEDKFKNPKDIQSGLVNLVKELGGLP